MSSERSIIGEIAEVGMISVVRGESARAAVEVSEALVEGGVRGVEITFTTPDAHLAMRELHERHGDTILLGAGTVTLPRHVNDAAENGARFLVSPGLDADLATEMRQTGLTTLPGVLTPSEVMSAAALGFEVVKLFPGSLGGPSYLKALLGPFPEMSFVPTGGVSEENVGAWLKAGALAVGVGGSLAPGRIEDERHRAEIVGRASRFVDALDARMTR